MKKKGYILVSFIFLSFLGACAGKGVYFTVTFKTNSKTSDIVKTVREGYRVNKPESPVNPGFEFDGWYYDNETFEYQYNFSTKVCQDFSLYAKWSASPVITLISNTLNYASMPSTEDYYCGIVSLKNQYVDDYEVPTIKPYYEIRIGGKRLKDENFKIENVFYGTPSAKIFIPKASVIDEVTITAEAYEKCLTFTAIDDSDTIISYEKTGTVDTSELYYQLKNDAGAWDDKIAWSDPSASVSLTKGRQMRVFNAKSTLNTSSANMITFASTEPIAASGNVMSLLNYGSLRDFSFYSLFKGMAITTAPVLPSTKLATSCYQNMFEGCPNLIKAPILSAVEFKPSCYSGMFRGASKIETAWINAETNLADRACEEMFKNCAGLKNVQVNFGGGVYWPSQTDCTKDWLPAGTGKIFYWNGSTNITELTQAEIYGYTSRIPAGWGVQNPY